MLMNEFEMTEYVIQRARFSLLGANFKIDIMADFLVRRLIFFLIIAIK
jgi:hypothetical protein